MWDSSQKRVRLSCPTYAGNAASIALARMTFSSQTRTKLAEDHSSDRVPGLHKRILVHVHAGKRLKKICPTLHPALELRKRQIIGPCGLGAGQQVLQ